MFKIVINDGSQSMPDDDIYYIIAKDGIYLKKRLGVMESIAPVKNISILQNVESMAKMHINPIPARSAAKILEFFKAVYKKFYGEAIVLLFYNEKTGTYRIVPPKQKVTAVSLDYSREIQIPGYNMIGTIHSHGSMSAFHSSVDDKDELTFDGLHITYGDVLSSEISISASIVSNGHRIMVDPEKYILGLSKTKDVDITPTCYTTKVYKQVDGKLVLDEKASKKSSMQTKYDKRYKIDVCQSKRIFNPKWMNEVEQGTYGNFYNYPYFGYNSYPEIYSTREKWNNHYDPSLWKQRNVFPPTGPVKSPLNVGPSSTISPLQFPPHTEQYDPKCPCRSCKHRDLKILSETSSAEYEDEVYKCEQCGTIIVTDGENISCPTCKKDIHLTLVDSQELKSNYKTGNNLPLDEIDYYAMQPDQLGMTQCLNCGNEFIELDTDECCPFCKAPLPDSIQVEQEWECPYCCRVFGESEMEDPSHCPHCGGVIKLTENEESDIIICPNCQVENLLSSDKCFSCSFLLSENEYQTKEDSGEFLNQTEEEHQSMLDAAAHADKFLERIPDPNENNQSLPLNTTKEIKEKMKKIFGGHNDTTH